MLTFTLCATSEAIASLRKDRIARPRKMIVGPESCMGGKIVGTQEVEVVSEHVDEVGLHVGEWQYQFPSGVAIISCGSHSGN